MNLQDIYLKSPNFVQILMANTKGYLIEKKRYSKQFNNYLQEYIRNDDFSYDVKSTIRDTKIRNIVNQSYNNVPFYRLMMDDKNILPEDINSIEDLKLLPLIDKETVKDNFDDFIARNIGPKSSITNSTHGTTGSGFKFLTTQSSIDEQWAVWWRYRLKLGINFREKCAIFGTKKIVPINKVKPPYWKNIRSTNQTYFSIYHISDSTIADYIKEINDSRVRWIHGIPSAIALIADYMYSNNITLPYVKIITTGSESLLSHQAKKMELAFGFKPYQHYGLAEGVANISEDKDHKLIVDEDFAAVEFLTNEYGSSEIVGSNLSNYAMPLLRYKTKDIVSGYEFIDSKGRIIKEIDGRIEDYIILPDGKKIGRVAQVFSDFSFIKESQIIQTTTKHLTVYIVPQQNNEVFKEEKVRDKLNTFFGNKLEIKIEIVDKINREKSGKLRFVKSDL